MSENNNNANDPGVKNSDNSINDNTSTGNITLDQFKSALENNIECKGYFDSLCDKTVNTRLDKSVESWKDKNLQTIIENEINKRYPQKTESEIKFEEQQKELEKVQAEKRQLELQIRYHDLMSENNLPMEMLDFVTGKDIESTINNIDRFKKLIETMVNKQADKIVHEKLGSSSYVPPSSNFSNSHGSMWDI